jgi:Leucine-rich repeat (LRR) protein
VSNNRSLTKLCLDNNSITKIEHIDFLVHLTWLDLSFNQIEKIEVRILYRHFYIYIIGPLTPGNREGGLKVHAACLMRGHDGCDHKHYVGHLVTCRISCGVQGLSTLTKLTDLSLFSNKIKEVEGTRPINIYWILYTI